MAKIRFLGQNKTVSGEVGQSILQVAQKAGGIPHGHACGGVCACSTCHIYIKTGEDLLSEMEDEENDILDKAFDVRYNSRLGCQAVIESDGDIEVELSQESVDAYYAEHPDS